jgi:hypothetical protein
VGVGRRFCLAKTPFKFVRFVFTGAFHPREFITADSSSQRSNISRSAKVRGLLLCLFGHHAVVAQRLADFNVN